MLRPKSWIQKSFYRHCSGALEGPSFAHLKFAHSNVLHKPPHPEFTRSFKLRIWNGQQWVHEIRVGGTQKLDGFFASFCREVGKESFNTTGLSQETADAMESQLHQQMRCFQFSSLFKCLKCAVNSACCRCS